MSVRTIKVSGSYVDLGKLRLAGSKAVDWCDLSPEAPPSIPYGTKMEMTIAYEERDYLHGENGIVWATYDRYQAETLKDALLAQNIACEVQQQPLESGGLYLLRVPEPRKIEAAIDFIWRDDSGLKLQPDWCYPAGAENESFKKWVNGIQDGELFL